MRRPPADPAERGEAMRNYKCYAEGIRGFYLVGHRNARRAARDLGRAVVITNMHDEPICAAVLDEFGDAHNVVIDRLSFYNERGVVIYGKRG